MRVCHRLWLVVALAVVGALVPSGAEAPAPASASSSPPTSAKDEAVRVEERFVHAGEMMTAIDREQPAARRQNRGRRYARTNDGVMSRARRLLFGDGAARPEPFPSPR